MSAVVHALPGLLIAAEGKGIDIPAPPIVFGVGAFVVLNILLLIVLMLGRDR